ncbi:FMN-binding glutamate synthase family protein [Metallosphaera hakonensis]|uniref:Archaeal glutamate synthase [NADPH] n=1 Tax=Metallosphaera hakonensis JCM 8857 = DSM 7519 TaxID=1293036 RepID=A0A2U9IUV2_9CREN|nr:FMN-binding glutamate synthase family protein [Metallosphaera hakonensis]AWR99826.1 FMN-binding glutamate synthase family protein [Metallosphaera hakonensis JCM 8857 = DSM 7519]
MIINKYLPVPKQTDSEFWTVDRLEHIRQLALTGEPQSIFTSRRSSLRILDRVEFKIAETKLTRDPIASTRTSFSGISMSAPLYLGDMSYGALSGNPNIAIAKAADLTETLAGTGEGGLHPEVAKHKRIFVQWASARFGVDVDVLNSGLGVVIKIGQGAKPGIGGHLPGSKVTEPISKTRRIPVGMDAISPAPHHDIYSIEDLGQRIEALKELTGKPVFVKVAATNYIPYVVSGIARMRADGVIIDGHGAGTGATPAVIRDNVGIPIELAVASADSVLKKEGLRSKFTIIAAGRVGDATDAAKLLALGADVVSVGTGALVAMGCVMVHKCHIGSCPTALTNKIDGTRLMDMEFGVKTLVNFIRGFSAELANILDNLNLSSVNELKGRRDLLYGYGLSRDTLEILGVSGEVEEMNPKLGELWTKRRRNALHDLLNKGEPSLTSMGSTAPPDVEKPARILDWLRSDGAQVTRPSIDPYREDIDTSFLLRGGDIYISLPVIFDVTGASPEFAQAFAWSSLALGTLVFSIDSLHPYEEISFSSDGRGALTWSTRPKIGSYFVPEDLDEMEDLANEGEVPGFILDEDLLGEDIELVISEADLRLKEAGVRNRYDLLAKSSKLRDSADVFKLVALGADSVIMPFTILEVAIGEGSKGNLKERTFNLIAGMRKEIALLAGSAGIYSIQSSLTGNRELLRAINLNSYLARKIRVRQAGSL